MVGHYVINVCKDIGMHLLLKKSGIHLDFCFGPCVDYITLQLTHPVIMASFSLFIHNHGQIGLILHFPLYDLLHLRTH